MQLLTLLLLVTASLSLGASTIEEIIVTADLEKQEIDIASSVFVLSEEAIEAREASHLEDVVNSIPNLNFASGSNRARFSKYAVWANAVSLRAR